MRKSSFTSFGCFAAITSA